MRCSLKLIKRNTLQLNVYITGQDCFLVLENKRLLKKKIECLTFSSKSQVTLFIYFYSEDMMMNHPVTLNSDKRWCLPKGATALQMDFFNFN